MEELIKLDIDGKQVSGKITNSNSLDLSVEMISPYNKIKTSTHIPYFFLYHRSFEENGRLSEVGRESASYLLKEIYFTCKGIEKNKMKLNCLLKRNFSEDSVSENYDKISKIIGINSSLDTLKSALEKLL